MLLLALVVFGVTAWFVGLRPGGYAGVVSLLALVMADVVDSTALAVYALHVLYIGGMIYLGPKVSRLVAGARPEPQGPAAQVGRWLKRGRALGEALWKSRR
ncbi:MAG: hypothetical protein HS111_16810 [Kofleriaceae bacterium]|nr:hypothetical protein [Kofleriaceae bacterium]MCL4228723.1 hypothetical protein [Myxococcales bacterium]